MTTKRREQKTMRRILAGAIALSAGLVLPAVAAAAAGGASLESAASQASSTGRTVALSLIGLALAVAAVVLVFKRDFKEAVGVLAIGIIAVLLASPVGLSVLQNTVSLLFGSG
jgi:F0F1-type ATP synthase membrane subunit c/vacuolar-type H+-ATPase subunit K